MSNITKAALAAAMLSLGLLPGWALAAGSSVQLVIGGEAYDGPPKFEVSFDGKVIGEGTVEAAIDTASIGRFADATDKADYVEAFSFAIPAEIFTPKGEVRVRFLNEAYGGDGSNRDRNLYLASVAVNGRAVTLSGLTTQGTTAGARNETLGEFLVLRDGNVEGVTHPPEGGWPMPDGTAVAAPAGPATAEATAPIQPTAAMPAGKPMQVASGAEPATAPAADTQPTTALAALPEPGSRPVAPPGAEDDKDAMVTASIAARPDSAPACLETRYNVIGFNENSNDLTQGLKVRLDQVVADIGKQTCRVEVVGYSSRQGAFDTNALFAIERAQNVLAYLRQSGLRFEQAVATGGGATDRFGPGLSANRRVVITVGP